MARHTQQSLRGRGPRSWLTIAEVSSRFVDRSTYRHCGRRGGGANSSAISASAQKEALIVDDDVARGNRFRSSVTARASRWQRRMTAGRPLPPARGNPKQFAVITTDLHLPGADGFDVLRAARDANPSVYAGVGRFPAGGAGGGEAETRKLKIEDWGPRTEDRGLRTED